MEFNRVDIAMKTSALVLMMILPRDGHLQQLLRMFEFLRSKRNAVMVFDPTELDIYESMLTDNDWSYFAYDECKEELPYNTPGLRAICFTIRNLVDSDHTGYSIT